MIKMKKEDIDIILNECFLKTDSCNILEKLIENMDYLEEHWKSNNAEYTQTTLIIASIIQTAMFNSLNTVREVLYKLCCEDENAECK